MNPFGVCISTQTAYSPFPPTLGSKQKIYASRPEWNFKDFGVPLFPAAKGRPILPLGSRRSTPLVAGPFFGEGEVCCIAFLDGRDQNFFNLWGDRRPFFITLCMFLSVWARSQPATIPRSIRSCCPFWKRGPLPPTAILFFFFPLPHGL